MRVVLTALVLSIVFATAAAVQEGGTESSPDVDRLVSEGLTEALEARLGDGREPENLHLLARAYANKARRLRPIDERQQAFEQADEKYRTWLEAFEKAAKKRDAANVVRLAAARVEYANMIPAAQAAGDLNDYEVYAGQRGDRARLRELLTAAREQYEKAAGLLAPLLEGVAAYEEELLAAGLYDTLLQTRLDLTLNLGWANYYLGVLEVKDQVRQRELLAAAARKFQELVDGGQVGSMRPQCFLALGMAQRELGRFDDAERSFVAALGPDSTPLLAAQVRYELARGQVKAGKFDEARTTLRPLLEKDSDKLSPEDAPARLYVNLAHLWDANSYLVEADALREQARDNMARTAILQKARRNRDAGLARMRKLAQRGGPWPELVQVYIAARVDLEAPPKDLSTVELLATAGVLMDTQRCTEALERLQQAAARKEADQDLAVEARFELARCRYLLKDERGAAEAFAKLAVECRRSTKAPQAATFAYQLWGKVAEETKRPEDYARLADVLRNLLASFADHPKRGEAAWLLPAALQLAGRFEEAAEEFAKVPRDSAHWEEAQYRRALCGRKSLEAGRAALGAGEYRTRAHKAAETLTTYADEARARAAAADQHDEVRRWSAEARLAAAESLAAPGVEDYQQALAMVAAFETQYPGSELLGRVLALRIRAYRGLREFEQASKILEQFVKAAPPEQIGGTLASLAEGMQAEVERLLETGQNAAAGELAADSVTTFAELEKWVRADPGRGQNLDVVRFGRARMLYFAGRFDEARTVVAALLEKSASNGNYQHLRALVLTARLTPDAPPEELTKAQEAWAALLSDAALRKRAPERYWEARYNWLALALRLGRAAEVEKAIFQESRWYPDLGGSPWKDKLAELYARAGGTRNFAAETEPTPETGSRPRP